MWEQHFDSLYGHIDINWFYFRRMLRLRQKRRRQRYNSPIHLHILITLEHVCDKHLFAIVIVNLCDG